MKSNLKARAVLLRLRNGPCAWRLHLEGGPHSPLNSKLSCLMSISLVYLRSVIPERGSPWPLPLEGCTCSGCFGA